MMKGWKTELPSELGYLRWEFTLARNLIMVRIALRPEGYWVYMAHRLAADKIKVGDPRALGPCETFEAAAALAALEGWL